MVKKCPKCDGEGLIQKGFWIFKKNVYCDECSGTGFDMGDKSVVKKKVKIDGDPEKMQEIFHILAEVRRKVMIARKEGKNTFDLHKKLRKVQNLTREKKYREAKALAMEANKDVDAMLI